MDLILSILFGILAVFGIVLILSVVIRIIDFVLSSVKLTLITIGIIIGLIIYVYQFRT